MSSSSSLSSQMAALEAAARDNDDETPSPSGENTNGSGGSGNAGGMASKGKLDSIKQDDDIKKEFMDDSCGGNNDSSQMDCSTGGGKGKNVNNDGTSMIKMEIKTEDGLDGEVKIKTEAMDVDEAGGSTAGEHHGEGGGGSGVGGGKDNINGAHDGGATGGAVDIKPKTETKPLVPEPLAPNAGDKKKKCRKYKFFAVQGIFDFNILLLFFIQNSIPRNCAPLSCQR